jgi:hypothetical protein
MDYGQNSCQTYCNVLSSETFGLTLREGRNKSAEMQGSLKLYKEAALLNAERRHTAFCRTEESKPRGRGHSADFVFAAWGVSPRLLQQESASIARVS